MDNAAREKIARFIENGLNVEDAFYLADIPFSEVNPEHAELARRSRLSFKNGLLSQLQACITEQIAGGKANSQGLTWLLEKSFPDEFGKGSGADSALPITINLGAPGAAAEPPPSSVSESYRTEPELKDPGF